MSPLPAVTINGAANDGPQTVPSLVCVQLERERLLRTDCPEHLHRPRVRTHMLNTTAGEFAATLLDTATANPLGPRAFLWSLSSWWP